MIELKKYRFATQTNKMFVEIRRAIGSRPNDRIDLSVADFLRNDLPLLECYWGLDNKTYELLKKFSSRDLAGLSEMVRSNYQPAATLAIALMIAISWSGGEYPSEHGWIEDMARTSEWERYAYPDMLESIFVDIQSSRSIERTFA